MSEINLLSVGYHKGEMDFGVNCSVEDLTYEEYKEVREMTMVAIGQMERMWSDSQEKKQDQPTTAIKNLK